jgi:hypothetical protein
MNGFSDQFNIVMIQSCYGYSPIISAIDVMLRTDLKYLGKGQSGETKHTYGVKGRGLWVR